MSPCLCGSEGPPLGTTSRVSSVPISLQDRSDCVYDSLVCVISEQDLSPCQGRYVRGKSPVTLTCLLWFGGTSRILFPSCLGIPCTQGRSGLGGGVEYRRGRGTRTGSFSVYYTP